MTARAPIVNINHDLRFVAAAGPTLKQGAENFHGFHAMGAYVVLELRVRGCVVVLGSSFWSKMACQMKPSTTGVHMLSVEAHGDGDEHLRRWRAFAIYEKQLCSEKMVSACFMDHNKIKDWDDNIRVRTISRQDFVQIWEDKGDVSVSTNVKAGERFNAENLQRIQSGAQGDSTAEHASAIWQDFDIAMTIPSAYYDDRHYWFNMDTYASPNSNYAKGKARKWAEP